MDETSKDYLRIPSSNSAADTVLTWPIFGGEFPPECLIVAILGSTSYGIDDEGDVDAFTVKGGFEPLSDERIPSLIDKFLNNVHTKNPILDVDALLQYGRTAAANGPGWDAPSCLVLLVCALGSISLPFDTALADPAGIGLNAPGLRSSSAYQRELRQAESRYVLACRRLGLLKHTILGAQCYFYSAVYLMYTFRPLPVWNHFCQASTFYQIYFRKMARSTQRTLLDGNLGGMNIIHRRIEQSLYWSCFKSECEIRVELPLPQSMIANIEYPHMFPSPPSFPSDNPGVSQYDGDTLSLKWGMRQHSNNEEKSWYYYLTGVALRRIGNRILNAFYRQDHATWMDINPLIPLAKEFEAQISVWSANLPPAMQYETSNAEELPSARELGWATWNRLLEMKSWLFQPFLYYAIHADPHSPEICENPVLQSLIDAAMECNLETVQKRSVRHRHHGIWFDLRAIVTASLSAIAAVKSGNLKVREEWDERIAHVIATLAFWEDEAPDLAKTKQVLEKLFLDVKRLIRKPRQ